MKRFKRILCLYTKKDDRSALEQAVGLARSNQAELTLIDVVDELPTECTMETAQAWERIGEARRKKCGDFLEHMAVPIQKKGVTVKTVVQEGVPAIRIIQEVLRHQYDLVVAAAQANPGLRALVWGSTVQKLIRACPVPVWVIKSTQLKPFRRIVAAVDPDPANPAKTLLNRKIIELALFLAERDGGKVTVLHCWSPKDDFLITSGYTPLQNQDRAGLTKAIQQDRKDALNQLLGDKPSAKQHFTVKLVKGRPGEKIAETARTLKSDLVVMGTVNRSGIAGLLTGSAIEETLERLNCSLLAVQPEGFKTPVTLD